jgi:ferritin-like metal-binding protein YciE
MNNLMEDGIRRADLKKWFDQWRQQTSGNHPYRQSVFRIHGTRAPRAQTRTLQCVITHGQLWRIDAVMDAGIGLVRNERICAQRTQDHVCFFPGSEPLTYTQATIEAADAIKQAALKK